MYLLDTDTCSYILRQRPVSVLERFERTHSRNVAISVITQAELLYGVKRLATKKVDYPTVMKFIAPLQLKDWDAKAAEAYAALRAELEEKGSLIATMDILIASHALGLGAVLVTNNTRHFARVPKLKVENWI